MKKLIGLLTLLVALTLAMPAAAQTEQTRINYCASTLSYELPEGWVAAMGFHNQYGISVRFASSPAGLTAQAPQSGAVLGYIVLTEREYIVQPARLNYDTDIGEILAMTVAQAPSVSSVSAITGATVRGQPAVYAEIHSAETDALMLLMDIGAETLGLISYTAPAGERGQWDAPMLALVESLRVDLQRFPAESDEFTLGHAFANFDCSFAFAYPTAWDLTLQHSEGVSGFRMQLANYDVPIQIEQIGAPAPGQARIDMALTPSGEVLGGDRHGLEEYTEQVSQQPGFSIVSQIETTINGYPALMIEMRMDGDTPELAEDVLALAIEYDDQIATLVLHSAPGELDPWRDILRAVAWSIWVGEPFEQRTPEPS
jgi:hypothetical protein